jgi:hypothetical protein
VKNNNHMTPHPCDRANCVREELMGNDTVRGVTRSPAGDPWRAFDALPRPIRDAMQDGVSPICPLKVRRLWRSERRQHGDEQAVAHVIAAIQRAQVHAQGRRT